MTAGSSAGGPVGSSPRPSLGPTGRLPPDGASGRRGPVKAELAAREANRAAREVGDAGARRAGPIVLVGDIGGPDGYHVGDEAMVSANLDWWRAEFPGAEIVVTSRDPAFSSRVHGVAAVREAAWARRIVSTGKFRWALRRYRGSRFVSSVLSGVPVLWPRMRPLSDLLAGASLLHISGGGNLTSRFPNDLRFRSTCALLARAFGVPVVATGQTLGPWIDEEDTGLLTAWVRDLEYLSVRDETVSVQWARKLGVREDRLRCLLDDAYWLEGRPPEGDRWTSLNQGSEPVIGLSLHSEDGGLPFPEEALRALARALDLLAGRHGARLVYLPHVTSPTREIDVAVGRRLRQILGAADRLDVVEVPLLDREVRHLTSECSLVIATRYHALVFALGAGVPCVGLSQDEYTATKIQGLFSMTGVPCPALPVWDPHLTDGVLDAWERAEESRRELSARNRSLSVWAAAERRDLAALLRRMPGWDAFSTLPQGRPHRTSGSGCAPLAAGAGQGGRMP